jgi:hypothetical protein
VLSNIRGQIFVEDSWAVFDTCGQPLHTRVDRSEAIVDNLFSHLLSRI